MLNQVVLIGKAIGSVDPSDINDHTKLVPLTLEIEKDLGPGTKVIKQRIPVYLPIGIAKQIAAQANVGGIIGIKGYIEPDTIVCDNGSQIPIVRVVADKVSFLSVK